MDQKNPLEVAEQLRRALKAEWVVDAQVAVEVADDEAWDYLVSVLRSTEWFRWTATARSSRPFEVHVGGVIFRLVRQPH